MDAFGAQFRPFQSLDCSAYAISTLSVEKLVGAQASSLGTLFRCIELE